MRKQSMIGGGEFEFEPHKLDLKVEKRKEYLDKAESFFINELNRQALEYQKQGLGIFENFRKDIVRALVMELRK